MKAAHPLVGYFILSPALKRWATSDFVSRLEASGTP